MKHSTYLLVLTAILAAPAPAAQGPAIDFAEQFGTFGVDSVGDVATTEDGSIWVLGGRPAPGGNPVGTTDVYLRRYGPDGVVAAENQWLSGGVDAAFSVTPDSTGGAFLCGWTRGSLAGVPAQELDPFLARADASGAPMWIINFGTSDTDYANGVAQDGVGGVYVGGYYRAGLGHVSGQEYGYVARYDNLGGRIWERTVDSPAVDTIESVAADGAGGVIACGYTRGALDGPNQGHRDAYLVRFDAAGNELWRHQFGTSEHEIASGVISDRRGGFYCTGGTTGNMAAAPQGNYDIFVAHFDGQGQMTWVTQFGDQGYDWPSGIATTSRGGCVITGWTEDDLGGPSSGGYDSIVASFDDTGQRLWIQQFGTPGGDRGSAVTVDRFGRAVTIGTTDGDLHGPQQGYLDTYLVRLEAEQLGTRYCGPAVPNSTGLPAVFKIRGSSFVADDNLRLQVSDLPPFVFGHFFASTQADYVVNPGSSQGILCIGGEIGRFRGPGQILDSGASGTYDLEVQPSNIPLPIGSTAAQIGETWHFQNWYRDMNPGMTSNFTDAVAVMFR